MCLQVDLGSVTACAALSPLLPQLASSVRALTITEPDASAASYLADATMLQRLADLMPHVQQLQLCRGGGAWCELSGSGATPIPPSLALFKNVRTLIVRNYLGTADDEDGKRTSALLPILRSFTNLQHLDLSGKSDMSHEPDTGEWVRNSTSLRATDLDVLAPWLQELQSLESLNLNYTMFSSDGGEALARCLLRAHALTELQLDGADCGNSTQPDSTRLGDCFSSLSSLKVLNVANSKPGEFATEAFWRKCTALSRLQSLTLRECRVGGSLRALWRPLAAMDQLQSLDLGGNSLWSADTCLCEFACVLRTLTSLTRLCLDDDGPSLSTNLSEWRPRTTAWATVAPALAQLTRLKVRCHDMACLRSSS